MNKKIEMCQRKDSHSDSMHVQAINNNKRKQ